MRKGIGEEARHKRAALRLASEVAKRRKTLLYVPTFSVYFPHMPKLAKTKSKIGRPPSERKFTSIQLKLPADLLDVLDRHVADSFEDSRASVIRRFIIQGLKREGAK
jgi:hypothetical protein